MTLYEILAWIILPLITGTGLLGFIFMRKKTKAEEVKLRTEASTLSVDNALKVENVMWTRYESAMKKVEEAESLMFELKSLLKEAHENCEKVVKERDELITKNDILVARLDEAIVSKNEIANERDEARYALEKEKKLVKSLEKILIKNNIEISDKVLIRD